MAQTPLHPSGGQPSSNLAHKGFPWAAARTGLVAAVALVAALVFQSTAYLNHDVGYLAWANGLLLAGKQYGVDFFESNHPLAILIYAPGWLLAQVVGPGAGIRLWVAAIALASLYLVWSAAPPRSRPWLTAGLALYFAFAFTREFGQREHLALLLCAPYVTGHIPKRGHAIASGVMAGLGFAIKPYFLIALLLVFAARPKVRTEELAIAGTGAVHALLLATVFQSYVVEMVPLTSDVYWAFNAPGMITPISVTLAAHLLVAILIWLIARERTTLPFLAAAIGFAFAAVLQFKWYPYHLVATWGFVILFLAAQAATVPRLRLVCAALLAVFSFPLLKLSWDWRHERDQRNAEVAALIREVDRSRSFSAISVHPYPASPTMFYARAPYVGLSNGQWFLPAAGKIATGETERAMGTVGARAVAVAVGELRRNPELVIVNPDWQAHSGLQSRDFDGVEWLQRDAEFRRLWLRYQPAGTIGEFRLYRLQGTDGTAAAGAGRP